MQVEKKKREKNEKKDKKMLHIKSAFSQDFSGDWCVQARVKALTIHPVHAKGLIFETQPNRFVDAAC